VVIQAVTISLRAHGASEQLKSPDTCVAPVASVKNGFDAPEDLHQLKEKYGSS
jgi:hypothetical protein